MHILELQDFRAPEFRVHMLRATVMRAQHARVRMRAHAEWDDKDMGADGS